MALWATEWLSDLLGCEHGFKLADEVGGADDVFAEAAEELDRAGIDHGDVHDVVVGRVLHGDGAEPASMASRPAREFLPA